LKQHLGPTTRSATTPEALRAHPGRVRKLGRILRRVFDCALAVGGVAAAAVFIGLGLLPRTGWYRTETVLSGSMKPYFAPGDMVVVTPEPARDVRVGQVISYSIPIGDHHVESHRIVKILERGEHPVIKTRGDANNAVDPWVARLDGDIAWRVHTVVPRFGWLVSWLRSPLFHFMTVFLAPFLLAVIWLARIWRRPGDGESGEPQETLNATPSVTSG
jgi:signal peptidase